MRFSTHPKTADRTGPPPGDRTAWEGQGPSGSAMSPPAHQREPTAHAYSLSRDPPLWAGTGNGRQHRRTVTQPEVLTRVCPARWYHVWLPTATWAEARVERKAQSTRRLPFPSSLLHIAGNRNSGPWAPPSSSPFLLPPPSLQPPLRQPPTSPGRGSGDSEHLQRPPGLVGPYPPTQGREDAGFPGSQRQQGTWLLPSETVSTCVSWGQPCPPVE